MYDRFTDDARRALAFAASEARRLNDDHIRSEHLLLGLLQAERGQARRALQNMGLDVGKLRADLAQGTLAGPVSASGGQLPFDLGAKKALELALEAAAKLEESYVTTGQLLIALMREGEGMAARALAALGLQVAAVERHVAAIPGAEEGCSTFDRSAPPKVLLTYEDLGLPANCTLLALLYNAPADTLIVHAQVMGQKKILAQELYGRKSTEDRYRPLLKPGRGEILESPVVCSIEPFVYFVKLAFDEHGGRWPLGVFGIDLQTGGSLAVVEYKEKHPRPWVSRLVGVTGDGKGLHCVVGFVSGGLFEYYLCLLDLQTKSIARISRLPRFWA